MTVRATDKFLDYFASSEPQIDRNKTVLIYSMRKEYINLDSSHANRRHLDFVEKFPVVRKIHTSGHVSADCLVDVCNLVNPKFGIIPIHSENSSNYQKLPIKENLKSKIITVSKTIDDIIIQITTKSDQN